MDEETKHQIMPGRRFGKAHRATHETLDPRPQGQMLALDLRRMLLANLMLLWVDRQDQLECVLRYMARSAVALERLAEETHGARLSLDETLV